MTDKDFIKQYNEVKEKYEGKSVEEIRDFFGHNITNDNGEYIDTNYKDILVTFSIKDGKGYLSNMVEKYNKEGIFLGVIYA